MTPSPASRLPGRRETRIRWVQRGRLAVMVPVEVSFPDEDPVEPCFEFETVRGLDEITRRAEVGDLVYLQAVGRVFEEVIS